MIEKLPNLTITQTGHREISNRSCPLSSNNLKTELEVRLKNNQLHKCRHNPRIKLLLNRLWCYSPLQHLITLIWRLQNKKRLEDWPCLLLCSTTNETNLSPDMQANSMDPLSKCNDARTLSSTCMTTVRRLPSITAIILSSCLALASQAFSFETARTVPSYFSANSFACATAKTVAWCSMHKPSPSWRPARTSNLPLWLTGMRSCWTRCRWPR